MNFSELLLADLDGARTMPGPEIWDEAGIEPEPEEVNLSQPVDEGKH